MRRRHFIRTAGIATAAFAFMPVACAGQVERKTGLILYTLRKDMVQDPFITLDRVSKIGYNWLEAADYRDGKFYGMKPSRFGNAVETRGMSDL